MHQVGDEGLRGCPPRQDDKEGAWRPPGISPHAGRTTKRVSVPRDYDVLVIPLMDTRSKQNPLPLKAIYQESIMKHDLHSECTNGCVGVYIYVHT